MGEDIVEITIPLQELFSTDGTDSSGPGNIVARVTCQRSVVRPLLHGDTVLFKYLLRTDHVAFVQAAYPDALRDELERVAVTRDDFDLIPHAFATLGDGTEQVIRFETGHFESE